MKLINGKDISTTIIDELKLDIENMNLNKKPGLGIILVGNRSDSKIYVRMKKRACAKIGITNFDVILDESISEDELIVEIEKMNENPLINGILVQLPLPKHINEARILSKVKIEKDVDGFHSQNVGNMALKRLDQCLLSCTPAGCMELLKRYNIDVSGKHAVILGRSNIVGLPMSLLLLHSNATVTICHSRTQHLSDITRTADIIIAAIGKPNFVTKDMIKDDVVIIDVGINRIPFDNKKGYKLVGDVDFEDVREKVGYITPVPGGVGPMTIAMLLTNTLQAFKRQN